MPHVHRPAADGQVRPRKDVIPLLSCVNVGADCFPDRAPICLFLPRFAAPRRIALTRSKRGLHYRHHEENLDPPIKPMGEVIDEVLSSEEIWVGHGCRSSNRQSKT